MKPLLVSSGEPAGIGPDICVQLAGLNLPLVVIGDPDLLAQRARLLDIPLSIKTCLPGEDIRPVPSTLHVYPVSLKAECNAGELSTANAWYVREMLETAVQRCLDRQFSALVTAPVHKAVINDAGISFSGHTEFLASQCGVDQVVMMLACDAMRVALATTHLPLNRVAVAIDKARLRKTIDILYQSLQVDFGIDNPVIYLAGLNPHAGESGYLGSEEIDTLCPVARECRQEGINISDPMPADTMFSPINNSKCDAYLAMYHDQGLGVIKYAAFGKTANITLGLPIIRTSVDHGTALDLAGKGGIDCASMRYAVQCAWTMAKRRQHGSTNH